MKNTMDACMYAKFRSAIDSHIGVDMCVRIHMYIYIYRYTCDNILLHICIYIYI